MDCYKSHLDLDSIINIRTFNHLKTQDNAPLKSNLLYRSATFDFGTKEDLVKVHNLDIDIFVDLRSAREKDPLLSKQFDRQFHRESTPINVGDFFSERNIFDLKAMDLSMIQKIFLELYAIFPINYQPIFKSLFNHMEHALKIAFHCSAGKDRTGISAYLILSALNVAEDDIMENFLESNLYSKQLVELFKDKIGEMNLELYEKMQLVHEEYLYAAIKSIQNEYGGTENYLTRVLDVDLEKIRENYLK